MTNEAEYRAQLIKNSRRRAAQIADGSYVNEPWAPSHHTVAMCRGCNSFIVALAR